MKYQALILTALAVACPLSRAQENPELAGRETLATGGAAEPGGAAGTDTSRTVTSRGGQAPAALRDAETRLDEVRLEARDDPPRISDLDLEFEGEQILLSFRLLNAFDDTLKRRIDSGLYSGFLFEFELVRDRKTWFNKNLDASTLQVVAMYNAVTREYLINVRQDGDLIGSRVVQDVADLERALTEFDDLAMLSIEGVPAHQRLRVRVRAELGTRTVFFFIPNTVHTDWAESERFRLSELE